MIVWVLIRRSPASLLAHRSRFDNLASSLLEVGLSLARRRSFGSIIFYVYYVSYVASVGLEER